MADYGGWQGKVLRVDLSTGKISSEDTIAKYKDFVGGKSLAYKVLWDEVPPGTDPFDPENRLIFGVGPTTGTGTPESGRHNYTSLWPLNRWSGPASGNCGGHWGAELKHAGWDSIIIQGKAADPVYLYINDATVEIRDARRLWGQGNFRTTAELCAEVGSDAKIISIGPAGENGQRAANIMGDRSHSGGGCGGIMGSKNLKAIVVKGSKSVKIAASPGEWKELVYYNHMLQGANAGSVVPQRPQPWAEYYGGGRWTANKGIYWGAANPALETGITPPQDINKIGLRTQKNISDLGTYWGQRVGVRTGGCHSCNIRCHCLTDVPSLEHKYGVSRYNSNTCSGHSHGAQYFDTIKSQTLAGTEARCLGTAVFDDNGVWNEYGGNGAAFVHSYRNGVMEAHLDGDEWDTIPWDMYEAGDPAFLLWLAPICANGTGELGKALAMGNHYLEEYWPEMAEINNHQSSASVFKLGHRKHHSVEASGQTGGLFNNIYNRDPQNHVYSGLSGTGLPQELKLEILNEITGFSESLDPSRNLQPITEGKVKYSTICTINSEIHNMMTKCDYNGSNFCSPLKSRNYRGDPELEAKLYSAVTGDNVDLEEMAEKGLRAVTMYRAVNIRQQNEMNQRDNHDMPNDWVFEYPTQYEAFDGNSHYKMDRDDYSLGMTMQYDQFGWDTTTGAPTRATYERLGLGYVADDLAVRGLLPA